MQRRAATPRPDFDRIVREQGLVYNTTTLPDGTSRLYWNESAYYGFRLDEILELERVTQELHQMCLDTVEWVIGQRRYRDFHVPESAWPAIERTWEEDSPSLYGRFDLRYDGHGPAKLLEYNADTPTALLEAAVIQWYWLGETHAGRDQWNSLHERLVACWKRHAPRLAGGLVHFAYTEEETSGEDLMTVTYLRETAHQAELATATLTMEEIGWELATGRFVDKERIPITNLFKLYPWEWIFGDRFGERALANLDQTRWIEPTWKCLLANKAILALLWERYPQHPNLLPAFLPSSGYLTSYVRKPILGREGANVEIVTPANRFGTPGPYGAEGYVYQEYAPLPDFDGRYPVLGAWVIDGEAAGMGIRESDTLITDNLSRFVPHLIE
jgi:glutathionylspermidine synthase